MDSQITFIHAFQTTAPNLGTFMQIVAFLGQPEFYLLFIPLILWCYDKTLGLRLAILLSISGALNDTLKIMCHSPRPYWVNPDVKAFTSMSSFGMPSAHAQNALAFFGCIATTLRKMWVWILCIAIIILIGVARVYQAVHFPLDVITGWMFGLVILLLFLRYETPAVKWLIQKPINTQLILVFCTSVAFIGLSGIALLMLGTWQVPAEWSVQALAATGIPINPLVPLDTLTTAGLLFGTAAGAILCTHYAPYTIEGSRSKKAIRYLVGVVILFILWIVIGKVMPVSGTAGYVMDYVRPAIAGIWITLGAPILFKKAGLVH
jgi:membrane-associated phospholipid phosphatase